MYSPSDKHTDNLGNPMVVASVVGKILPTLLIAGGGLYLINKFKTPGKEESVNREKYWFTDEKGMRYNAIDLATRYRAAIKGPGSAEKTIFALAKLSRGTRFTEIAKAYYKIEKESLATALEGDLSETELATFYAIQRDEQNQNQLPGGQTVYEFAIGETLKFKGYGISYLFVKKVNGSYKFFAERFFNIGEVGTVLDRKRFKKSGETDFKNFYELSDYPGLFIIGAAFQRIA
jgi:hypothetical protein